MSHSVPATAPQSFDLVVVDDDPDVLDMLRESLEEDGHRVRTAASYRAGARLVAEAPPDVAIVDLYLGEGPSGLDLIEEITSRHPSVRCGLISGYGTFADASEAVDRGARFLLAKPFSIRSLCRALTAQAPDLPQDEPAAASLLVGDSVEMRQLHQALGRVAEAESPALIVGETGTGKELVARALHARSPRARGPFVALNCMAVSGELLESELFGHIKGAFTGADADRDGLFREASGGTLFFDEIGDMPPSLQGKLLRVLELNRVRPVGATRDVPVDVRIVAATHRDLEQRVEDGLFRADLRYRIDVLRLRVPPLRDRIEDIDLLAQHLLDRASPDKPRMSLASDARAALRGHAWPGNVRELRNVLEHARVHAEGGEIRAEHLPLSPAQGRPRSGSGSGSVSGSGSGSGPVTPLRELEREQVLAALEQTGGNKRKAARILGIDRSTLYRKLKRWGL